MNLLENAPVFGRRESIIQALQYLDDCYKSGVNIVETGTLRSEDKVIGDGWSTVAWGWYVQQTGGHLWTVDIDEHAIEISKQYTAEYAANITYVQSDSVSFLQGFPNPIHFLYLDSLDTSPWDKEAMKNAAEHQLREIEAAYEKLAEKSFVLIDDVSGDLSWGKGLLSIPFLQGKGWQIIFQHVQHQQVLLSR